MLTRADRHRNDAESLAGKKGDDKLGAIAAKKHQPFALPQTGALQTAGNAGHLLVEFGISEPGLRADQCFGGRMLARRVGQHLIDAWRALHKTSNEAIIEMRFKTGCGRVVWHGCCPG